MLLKDDFAQCSKQFRAFGKYTYIRTKLPIHIYVGEKIQINCRKWENFETVMKVGEKKLAKYKKNMRINRDKLTIWNPPSLYMLY